MPAATLVIIVTVIVSYVVLGPLIGNQTADDGRWASVFLINVHFTANGTNYLPPCSHPRPRELLVARGRGTVLHLVSDPLPPRRMVGPKRLVQDTTHRRPLHRDRRLLRVPISDTLTDAQGAYFSLLTRSWELALGALIAVHGRHFQRIPRAWAAIGSWAGLAAIMICAVTLTGSSRYPGALVAFRPSVPGS